MIYMIYNQPFYIDPKYNERLKEMTHDEVRVYLKEFVNDAREKGFVITRQSLSELMDKIRKIRGEETYGHLPLDTLEELKELETKINQIWKNLTTTQTANGLSKSLKSNSTT